MTVEDIRQLDGADINKLDKKELTELYRDVVKHYKRQEKAILDKGEYFYSDAYESMKKYYRKYGEVDASAASISRMKSEIAHIVNFFQAKTSDIRHADAVLRAQNILISGDKYYKLKSDDRAKYWDFYEEWAVSYSQTSVNYYKQSSEYAVQYVADKKVKPYESMVFLKDYMEEVGVDWLDVNENNIKRFQLAFEAKNRGEDWKSVLKYTEGEIEQLRTDEDVFRGKGHGR